MIVIARALKLLLLGTIIFHIVRTTYQVNVLEQKIQNIYVVLGRVHAEERTKSSGLDAFKKDAAPGLGTMLKTYPKPPQPDEQFDEKLRSGKVQ